MKLPRVALTVLAFALAPIACPSTAGAEPIRNQMRNATVESRNVAFQTFLAQHHQSCQVRESIFGATATHPNGSGDIWSVRCSDDKAYAIIITNDERSTSWFLPCEQAARISSFRCFHKVTTPIVFQ